MLREFMKKNGWRYIPGALLLLLCAWVQTRAPLALGNAMELAVTGDWPTFSAAAWMILVIALGIFVTRFSWRFFIIRTSREMEVYLRDKLYAHLVYLPVSFYGQTRSGDLMTYAISDVNAVRMMFGMVFAQVLNALSSVLFSVGEMAFSINPSLTLYALLPVPLAVLVVLLVGRKIQVRSRHVQELFSKLTGHVQENINGMRVLKAFAQEKPQVADFTVESDEMCRANTKLYNTEALLDPLISVIFGVSYAIGLIYGGQLVQQGNISLANYVAFNAYLTMIVTPVIAIGRVSNTLERGMASYKRLKSLMDLQETPVFDRSMQGNLPGNSLDIRHLTFRYPGADTDALTDITVHVPAGGTLGIVGETGSGKTTLLLLLMKLYQPENERIFIGDADAAEIPAAVIREQAGYVPQDGFLFSGTIAENVAFFSGADAARVERALGIAGMHEDLDAMPDGVNTQVGERGNHLSGGQRQRVALARALVRDPRILLLDDTLSAVDAHTEGEILRALRAEMRGRTSVIVAHRLSAVRDADEIIYLVNGRIAERGTHQALLEKQGLYAQMYRKQQKKEA